MKNKIISATAGERAIIGQLANDPDVHVNKTSIQVRRTASRICFFVEHGDYNGTDLFGAAIGVKPKAEGDANGFIWFAFSPNNSGRINIKSLNYPDKIASFSPGDIPSPDKITPGYNWTKFPMGAVYILNKKGYVLKKGLDGVMLGKIPEGGLSRSASLSVNLVYSLLDVNGYHDVDPYVIVDLAQAVENEYVHSPCGKLDQIMIVFGEKGKGVQYFSKQNRVELISMPENADPIEVIILDTGTKRQGLQSSDYKLRQQECYEIRKRFGEKFGFKELADITPEIYLELANNIDSPKLRARLKYIFESTQIRAPEFLNAWKRGDWATAGKMMNLDGIGLRDDYDLSSHYLEAMVVAARTDPNILGARFSGGGRFGACQALRKSAPIEKLNEVIANGYGRSHPGLLYAVHHCEFVDGVVKLI